MALRPDYATLAEFKTFLRIPIDAQGGDNDDDALLTIALNAASRAVETATNRQFGLNGSAVARLFTPRYDSSLHRYVVQIDDLMTITALVVKTDRDNDGVYEETITDYALSPANSDGKPWTDIVFGQGVMVSTAAGSLEVTADWGWTTVPDTIKLATLLQAARLFKRRDAPFGIAGSLDLGSELRLFAKVDPDVEVLLRSFRRWWAAA